MKYKIYAILLCCIFLSSTLSAAELDPNYIKNFGWGIILASTKGMIAKDKCDMAQFDFSNGKFNIIADENIEINFRVLLKDGKNFGFYTDKVKKANAKKYKTITQEFYRTYFFVSHENGNEVMKTWPKTLNDIPDWKELFIDEQILNDEFKAFNGCAITWTDIMSNTSSLQEWIKNARKGYKIYCYTSCGFIREASESQYWDDSQLKYITPIEYVESEPIAAGTIEITGSNNPLLLWSYKITSMPEQLDGYATGQATIYKNGSERKKVVFTVKPAGNKDTYSLMVKDVVEGTGFFGGFDVTASKIEDAIDSAIYQLIERHLQIGGLED